MALNDPRTIPYNFRVFAFDGWCWLYDDSERTYICSATPMIYAESLYPLGDDDDAYDYRPDPDYFGASDIERMESFEIGTAPEDEDRESAWDDAREEANGNCRL
jgi:hypothetical protein